MVLNYLFTGLIAALMAVPGTGQKEIAKVGEEPVVKGKVYAEAWFQYQTGDIDNPLSYVELPSENDGTIDEFCDDGLEQLCSIKVEMDPTTGKPLASALQA